MKIYDTCFELSWGAAHRRQQWLLVAFLAVIGVGAIFLAIVAPDDVSTSPWLRVGSGISGLFALVGAVNFVHEARLARRCLTLNADGIHVLQGGALSLSLAWREVGELKTKFSGGNAARLTFLARDRKKTLLTFSTEGLEQQTNAVLVAVWTHLRELVTGQCEADLANPAKLTFAGISNVVELHANLLTIEFPKGKKTPLQLADILHVSVSSDLSSRLRIHHRRGVLELPTAIPCSVVLLQWLWSRPELAGRVLPLPREDGKAEHARLARRLHSKSLAKFIGTLVLVLGGFHACRGMRHSHPQSEIKSSGVAVEATYVEKAGANSIKLMFITHAGGTVSLSRRVEPIFFEGRKPGATMKLFYLPTDTDAVWFEHCWSPDANAYLTWGGLMAVLFLGGIVAVAWGCTGIGTLSKRIAELADIPPPAPDAPPPAPAEPPANSYEESPAAVHAAGGKLCAACGRRFAGTFYTCGQLVHCESCRNAILESPPTRTGLPTLMKAGCLGYLAAFGAAAVWATVSILTGYAIGLIAVVVGLIIGAVVRQVSGGGRRYQVLALILTITALAYATVPMVIHELLDKPELRERLSTVFNEGQAVSSRANERQVAVTKDEGGLVAENNAGADAADTREKGTSETSAHHSPPTMPAGILGLLIALAVFVLAVMIGPYVFYVIALIGDPFGLIFLGIALWEAWKLAAVRAPEFAGPFTDDEQEDVSFERLKPV